MSLLSRFLPTWLGRVSDRPGASLWGLIAVCSLQLSASTASGQQSVLGGVEPNVSYPSQAYYAGLDVYRDGDLEEAVELFEQALRRARRDINGRWIDSIPSLAMQAECNWQLGDLESCKANLDLLFQIAIQYRGWLSRVDWTTAVKGNARVAPERGLWPAAAQFRRLPIADKMNFRSGAPLTAARVRAGGAIEEPNIKRIDIAEVMRGLAIGSYRRRVVLGPLSKDESLASGLLEATKYPSSVQLPLARTLIGAMRVSEKFANHDDTSVIGEADKFLTVDGAIHPLTPMVLLSKASAMAGTDKASAAAPIAMQAASAAAALGQPEWIGEAFQLAAGCTSSRQEAASVREVAQQATHKLANDRVSRLAALHGTIAAADAAVTAGQASEARQFLSAAESIASRRDVLQPRLDAYWGYVAARVASANGESLGATSASGVDSGLSLLQNFAFSRRFRGRQLIAMPRIFQLQLIQQSIGKSLGGNRASELLDEYIQDPPIEVWRRDPVNALAASLYNRAPAEAAWIELAASRTDARDLIQRIDFVLGSRFLRRLPLAGRLAQVRHLASADQALLTGEAKEFRNQPPEPIAKLRQAVIGPGAAATSQRAEELEAAACEAAFARISLPRSMPPLLGVDDVSQVLPPRVGMLTFFFAGNRLHVALAADGQSSMWSVPANRLSRQIASVLRGIGVGRTRGNRLPEDDRWKKDAADLRAGLLGDDARVDWEQLDELIVVPDGPLWYLPMEILPIGNEDGPLVGDAIKVRYAATPGLAIRPAAPPAAKRSVGVIASSFFAPRDPDLNEQIVSSITDVLSEPVRLPGEQAVASSLLGDAVGHLLVAAPQAAPVDQPLKLAVAAYDASSPQGTLAAWLRFPEAAPRSIVLAGFRTPVGAGRIGGGDELFMTICALHAAGVRDVVISRWAVGGKSTATLMRELLQELPFTGMADAWNRARALLRESEVDPATEPLLMQAEHRRQGITGDQPLFWSGYIVASPFDIGAGGASVAAK